MTISIRRANADDARTLAQLNAVVHQLHVDEQPDRYKPLDPTNPDLIAIYEGHLANESAYVFIALDDDKPIGYLVGFLREITENPFIYSGWSFHIDQMSVEVAYQGKGVGHLLLDTAIQTARELQADMISLGVAAFNQHAISFYEKHGFEIRSLSMWQHLKTDNKGL